MATLDFDPAKDALNVTRHGISLAEAQRFDWQHALLSEDARHDYHEIRYRALGCIGLRVFVLIFTVRDDSVRLISLRKANRREERMYAHRS